jgi:hypothetical protein
MASEVKTNKVSPSTGTDVTLGDASDTFTIPASVTLDVNGIIDVTGATTTGFPSSGFNRQVVYTASTSAGGYSPETDVTKITVEVQGAGGGASNNSVGTKVNGGGGGGYARKTYTVVSSDTMTVTIGAAGGAGGTNGAGSNGGDTIFASVSGTSLTTITGGGGGGGAISVYGIGSGGTATNGDLNLIGQYCNISGGSLSVGGNSLYGWGGLSRSTASAAVTPRDGQNYGGGGGSGGDAAAAGAGSAGLCIITEYK